MIERALSLTPWWCAVVAAGLKPIENRKWPTTFRGEFYLHASLGKPADQYEVLDFLMKSAGGRRLSKEAHDAALWLTGSNVTRGAIIGRARLVDCVTESDSPWFFGPYGFVLEDVQRMPVVMCRGMLGFWKVPADVLAKLEAA